MLISPAALAQQGPGGPGGGPGGDQRREDRGPGGPGGGFDRPPGGGPGGESERGPSGGPGGPGGPGGGGPGGGMNRRPGGPGMPPPPMDTLRGYHELVRSYANLSRDPTTAGIAAVIAAADLLKPRGAQAGIDYFNKILPDVKNEAIQRAIRGQLAELYKQSGQADKALEQLQTLMTSAP